jgi:hypothetical protein
VGRDDIEIADAGGEAGSLSARMPVNRNNVLVYLEPAEAHGLRSLDPNSFGDYCRGADPR